ncbi:uncharacterized protein LOC131666790 [Phymastichus coffea]|uniref:uncharacterized protein LOC131666790 n=1 Tax=Phymastichus coffea TaxID=108790 RepID=UPI00273A939B|nr:uncharacterized protein LOC131666790 [Phymastichus coffea]XP_058795697.1 uncharacterized protein LOC131666790 [Phymastichus coffea]
MDKLKLGMLALIWQSLLYEFSLANRTVDVQHKKLDFPKQELVFSSESYVDGNDVYAACKTVDKSDERLCKVVREKAPNSREIQSCDVTLKLDNRTEKSDKNNDKLSVVPLGKDYAVFYLAEEGKNASVKFSIINLNNCKIAVNKISVMNPEKDPKYTVIVVPYNDSFDVYYRDSNKCGDVGFCKIIINIEGKIVNGPIAAINTNLYQSFFPYVVPMCKQSRNKGIFYMKYVNGSLSEYHLILQQPDGSEKSLGQHKAYSPTRKSTTNDLIGVCLTSDLVNSTIKCVQYDADGTLKFEVDAMTTNDSAAIVHVYNLPKGGLLLLVGKCVEKRDCESDQVSFMVVKMDSTGKKLGSFDLDKFNFETNVPGLKLVPVFYINKDNKYCISIVQYQSTDSGSRTVGYISSTTSCLTDAHFSI